MTKQTKPDAAPQVENVPAAPLNEKAAADPLLTCLEGWCRTFSGRDAAKRLRKALAAKGIETTDDLARASIPTVADVLRVELRLDAQSLTAAAVKKE